MKQCKHSVELTSLLGSTTTVLPKTRHSRWAYPLRWTRAFFNWCSGGWSPIGSTRHCGHCDYDDGEIGGTIGRGNQITRRKPAPIPLCPPQTPHAIRKANPTRRGGKPANNCLSYGTASHVGRELTVLFIPNLSDSRITKFFCYCGKK
jgi:hypothetical protein